MSEKDKDIEYSIRAAKNFIRGFETISAPTDKHHSMLATAHYTLSLQDNIPISHCRMHTNAAISLLQGLNSRDDFQNSIMANAYFRRAEFFEKQNDFAAASQDYEKILTLFQNPETLAALSDQDKLLLAQSAISQADLLIHQEENLKNTLQHPLFYVNKALSLLQHIPKTYDDVWTTLAYAHQVAGLAFANVDLNAAKEAFRTAITLAFKTEPDIACRMLGDIYNSLGLLYEQQFRQCPIQKVNFSLNDQSMIYLTTALFFTSHDLNPEFEETGTIDILFETIERCLDPYLLAISSTVLRDFIDALIFIYSCVVQDILPNTNLCQQLRETNTLHIFAQHVVWLLSDYYRKEHPEISLLENTQPFTDDLSVDFMMSSAALQGRDNIVYYLPDKT